MESPKVKNPLPYPQIENAANNPQAVAVLKKLYCSRRSETTAVLQYMYQHFVAGRTDRKSTRLNSSHR